MKKAGNTNVFKLSGNIALGGSNDIISNQKGAKGYFYGVSSSNSMKKPPPPTYINTLEKNYEYEPTQKLGTGQKRKSQNQQKNEINNYNMQNNYGVFSSKKIDYGSQNTFSNALNKRQIDQQYTKANYNKVSNINQDISKDAYNNGNYVVKIQKKKESVKGSYQNIQENPRINKPQTYQYSKLPIKSHNASKQSYNQSHSQNFQQQSYINNLKNQNNHQSSSKQIKEYDPSTFIMCRQGCGRKFNPDSISKHQKICRKVFQNKRPQFNVQEQRIVANEQKNLMKQGKVAQKKIEQKKKMDEKKQNNVPKWKAESLGFRAILKANRRGGEMTQQEKKIVSQAQDSSMVKCKFCGRSFNEKAAQRHIPFCESQQKKNAIKKKK